MSEAYLGVLFCRTLLCQSFTMQPKICQATPNPNPNIPMPGSLYFLQALSEIQHKDPLKLSLSNKGKKIRRAAYLSMAVSAAPRKTRWSRALLRRLRRRSFTPKLKVLRISRERKRREKHEDELRKLVPGGKRMDFCSLLEETGDYLQCLSAQVSLMKWVARSISQ